jgi:phosphatidate cytidylyltransferase
MAGRELGRRVAVSVVGLPVVLGAIWAGGWALGALAISVAALGVREFYDLARARGVRPFDGLGIAASMAVVALATALPTPSEAAPPVAALLAAVVLMALAAPIWLRRPDDDPLAAASVTLAGVVYVGGALAFVPLLRWLPSTAPGALTGNQAQAAAFVLFPLVVTWAGDTAAYFGGRAFGRRQLAPRASPGKTVEGAAVGLAGSAVGAALVSWWALADLPFLTISVPTAVALGLALGIVAQVGDLAESVLKRRAGVKDSGGLLPGHGGVLDRLDGLLFTLPATWLLYQLVGVVPGGLP